MLLFLYYVLVHVSEDIETINAMFERIMIRCPSMICCVFYGRCSARFRKWATVNSLNRALFWNLLSDSYLAKNRKFFNLQTVWIVPQTGTRNCRSFLIVFSVTNVHKLLRSYFAEEESDKNDGERIKDANANEEIIFITRVCCSLHPTAINSRVKNLTAKAK